MEVVSLCPRTHAHITDPLEGVPAKLHPRLSLVVLALSARLKTAEESIAELLSVVPLPELVAVFFGSEVVQFLWFLAGIAGRDLMDEIH